MKTKLILFFLALLAYACAKDKDPGAVYWDPKDPPTKIETKPEWIPLGSKSLVTISEKKSKNHVIACRHSNEGIRWQEWRNGKMGWDDLEDMVYQKNILYFGGGFNYNLMLTPPLKDNLWYYVSIGPNRRPNHPGGKPPKKGSPPPPKN
jgi:hypothetical protein